MEIERLDNSQIKWIFFIVLILTVLILDLGVFNKKDHEIGVKESLYLSSFYIGLGLLFGVWIYFILGIQSAEEYLTGFFIEKSLSLDNIFVISIIFQFFNIPSIYQHRVLFWGILGVIVLRGIMISLGAVLVAKFSWVLYIFSIFLIFTGIKLFTAKQEIIDIKNNKILLFLQKHLPTTTDFNGHDFFIKKFDYKANKIVNVATPLFIALIMIETADIIFAVDSVPAIFTITTEPYIVYTSNIFAILGLRALFFALSAVIRKFKYLKYALSIVLVFIGSKIFIADFMGWEKFPASVSLGITISLLAAGIILSLISIKKSSD